MAGDGSDERVPTPSEPSWQQPGGLHIKQKRSWATWQLVAAAAVAVFIGMAIGHSGPSASGSSASPAGFTTTTAPGGAASSTTTTRPGATASSTTTSAKPGATPATTTTVAVTGTPSVLVPNTNGTGPQTLAAFTVAGGEWKIGWAYRCVLAPGGTGKFQVFVIPDGGVAPATATVDVQGRDGQDETAVQSAGRQRLEVRTDAACQWAVKVVGVAG